MPLLDIPKRHREAVARVRDLPEEVFSELLVKFEQSPFDSTVPDEARGVPQALRLLYRYRLYADVPVNVFVSDVLDALREYKLIGDEDVSKLGERLGRILGIDAAATAIKASILYFENQHRYCTARIITDLRPVFGSEVSEAPSAMVVSHILRITYHENENDTKEMYFALQPGDLTELRELIERAEAKESSLKSMLTPSGIKFIGDTPKG